MTLPIWQDFLTEKSRENQVLFIFCDLTRKMWKGKSQRKSRIVDVELGFGHSLNEILKNSARSFDVFAHKTAGQVVDNRHQLPDRQAGQQHLMIGQY